MKVPNNRPSFTYHDFEMVEDAMKRGEVSGDGHYTGLVASFIKEKFNTGMALMTTSCTHALEMAFMLMNLEPDDEVIMPSFTFPSTANAVILGGGKPVFAEICSDTLNIDPKDLEKKITNRTKAVIPVHYGGTSCEMEKIMDIAQKNKLYVVEDAAQAVNAKYKGRYLGTWGHMGCYSFHGTKNYTSGEGGALMLNRAGLEYGSFAQLVEQAEIIRQKGTNRSRFIKGEVDRYSWVDKGSSYTPSDILMALLYAQLSQMYTLTSKRKSVFEFYSSSLKPYEDRGLIKLMHIPEECESNYHLFYLIFNNGKQRDTVMHELNSRGIAATIHFVPLHSSPMGMMLGWKPGDLPVTEKSAECLLRLPLFPDMSEEEMEYVVKNLKDILSGSGDVL